MDEHRDIYKKPGESNEPSHVMPAYELTPEQVRTRTRQQIVVFSVIMVGLLAVAATYFHFQEAGRYKTKLEEALNMPLPARKVHGALPSLTPQLQPMPEEDLTRTTQVPTSDVSPQKMADAMGQLRMANEQLKVKKFDSAEAMARKALAIWPEMNAATRMLGMIYLQRGQFDQAVAMLERALKTDPFSAETFNNLAAAYMQKRVFSKAEELLLIALQVRPDFPVARINLGLLYVLWGRYDQAIDNMEEALKVLPEHPGLLNNIGVAYIRLGRFDDAREHFDKLVARSPDNAAPYFNVAITYALEQNYEKAMEWIHKGADHCDSATAQTYLADSDFDGLRSFPAFQQYLRGLYPELPVSPGT